MTHKEQLYQKDLIIQKLEQQLAEKDKEIEKLKNKLEECSNSQWYIDLDRLKIPKEIAKQIRKQVCDELRNWLNENFIRIGRIKNNEPIVIAFDNEDLMNFLDQIEKGE